MLEEEWIQKGFEVPEIVLVKRHYPKRRKKKAPRIWRLKRLQIEAATNEAAKKKGAAKKEEQRNDLEEFLEDIEEDPELR